MTDRSSLGSSKAWLLGAIAGISLAACAGEAPDYETDTVDESGGELIVEDATNEGVDVELPETAMTPVAPEEAPAE